MGESAQGREVVAAGVSGNGNRPVCPVRADPRSHALRLPHPHFRAVAKGGAGR